MSSIKCQSCGLVNFADAEKCKRCQKPLVAAPFTSSKTSLPWKKPSPEDHASAFASSDLKTILRLLPFVIFGVPLLLALKDRMFDPAAKVGGYVDTLQLSVIVGCTVGLIISTIVIVLTRKK